MKNSEQIGAGAISAGEIIARDFNLDTAAFLRSCNAAASAKRKALTQVRRREYDRWRTMIRRCEDPSVDSYKYYGAKGIKVCDRWHDFECFFADMGASPSPSHSIDRIESGGDYEPTNCRWATDDVQRENRYTNPPKGSVCLIGGKWRALVRVKGKSASKFFSEKMDAVIWAEEKSLEFCG